MAASTLCVLLDAMAPRIRVTVRVVLSLVVPLLPLLRHCGPLIVIGARKVALETQNLWLPRQLRRAQLKTVCPPEILFNLRNVFMKRQALTLLSTSLLLISVTPTCAKEYQVASMHSKRTLVLTSGLVTRVTIAVAATSHLLSSVTAAASTATPQDGRGLTAWVEAVLLGAREPRISVTLQQLGVLLPLLPDRQLFPPLTLLFLRMAAKL